MDSSLRQAGRVVLLDTDGRVLLIRERESVAGRVVWHAPGGGVEQGETFEEAALREFWEETGLDGFSLGSCVWERHWSRRGPGNPVDAHSRFFLVRTSRLDQKLVGVSENPDYRWWSIEEIEAAVDETFIPRRIAELLRPLCQGQIPAHPINVSDDAEA